MADSVNILDSIGNTKVMKTKDTGNGHLSYHLIAGPDYLASGASTYTRYVSDGTSWIALTA